MRPLKAMKTIPKTQNITKLEVIRSFLENIAKEVHRQLVVIKGEENRSQEHVHYKQQVDKSQEQLICTYQTCLNILMTR